MEDRGGIYIWIKDETLERLPLLCLGFASQVQEQPWVQV